MLPETAAPAPPAAVAPRPAADQRFSIDPGEAAPLAQPLALAAGGAALGALLWAGVAYATGWEIGYLAWILGGLVGGGCVLGGGRGTGHATAAAALAFAGIFGGRFLATEWIVAHEFAEIEAALDRDAYEEMRAMAAEMAKLPAAPLAERMVAETGEELSEEEMAAVVIAQEQFIAGFQDPDLTYERWRDQQIAALRTELSITDIVLASLGPVDILFVLLGLSTAFSVVARATARRAA